MSNHGSLRVFVEVTEGVEVEFEVEYDYYAGSPGRMFGPPENCSPPEPEEIEFTEFTNLETGEEIGEEAFTRLYGDLERLHDDVRDDANRFEEAAEESRFEDSTFEAWV